VTLPALGESVTEGTVTRWLKQVGDDVAVDEPLLEVSTDKVDTEIPSPVAGKLIEIKVQEDETVEVGAELAIVGSGEAAAAPSAPSSAPSESSAPSDTPSEQAAGASAPTGDGAPAAGSQQDASQTAPSTEPPPAAAQVQPDAGAESSQPQQQAAPQAAPQEAPQPAPQLSSQQQVSQQQAAKTESKTDQWVPSTPEGGSSDGGAYVTPLVRKMAADQGVDLSSVKGTGVGGRIRKQDVMEAAKAQKAAQEKPAAEPAAAPSGGGAPSQAASALRGKTEPLTRLRKVIAKRMVESLQTSAQLTTVVEVDVTSISRLRDAAKEEFLSREGVKLSFLPFFAKAAIDALKAHPSLNAAIDTEKGEVTYYDHENLSIAVDTEKGLLTPVIKEAGDLSVAGLARKIADIADRTRNNKIGPDELAGGTFTLTNTGSRGALFDTPIINQPQVAILGTGTVVKRPVVIDDPNLGETIAVRRMVYLALTYDHRLVDGADAARFLSDVKERLEAGQFEV
jgi:2-oxoglutarate dehydrogenase E2 component (dihydrolipoamide succinyltransferase)